MRVTLRKHDGVTGGEMHRRLAAAHLDVALAFGDEVKDDDTLGARLQEGRCGVRGGRVVAPRRRELRLDEDGADEAHHAQGFRQRIHAASLLRNVRPALEDCFHALHRGGDCLR
jgi:hypothetical protein